MAETTENTTQRNGVHDAQLQLAKLRGYKNVAEAIAKEGKYRWRELFYHWNKKQNQK